MRYLVEVTTRDALSPEDGEDVILDAMRNHSPHIQTARIFPDGETSTADPLVRIAGALEQIAASASIAAMVYAARTGAGTVEVQVPEQSPAFAPDSGDRPPSWDDFPHIAPKERYRFVGLPGYPTTV